MKRGLGYGLLGLAAFLLFLLLLAPATLLTDQIGARLAGFSAQGGGRVPRPMARCSGRELARASASSG
jgi:hypothetical protein